MSEQLKAMPSRGPFQPPMTPQKAIEILSDAFYLDAVIVDPDVRNALKLAVHALRAQLPTYQRGAHE